MWGFFIVSRETLKNVKKTVFHVKHCSINKRNCVKIMEYFLRCLVNEFS